jgi:haloacetate dehalogenase
MAPGRAVVGRGGHAVVCPDLRGYGRSSKPAPDDGHEVYCDRAMADDIVALMTALGHERFTLWGTTGGATLPIGSRWTIRSASALAVLDGVPIVEALERADARFAEMWWHWFFFSSPHAERVITADPLAWYRLERKAMGAENHEPRTTTSGGRGRRSVDGARDGGGLPGGAAR